MRALFTTDQTIEAMWRTAPNANGHASAFTSTRTSGVRALMDPEGTSSGFYRSLVTDPTLTTTMVTGVARHGTPSGGAPRSGPRRRRARGRRPSTPMSQPPRWGRCPGPRSLRARGCVVARPERPTAFDGSALYEVEGLDDPEDRRASLRGPDLAPHETARVPARRRGRSREPRSCRRTTTAPCRHRGADCEPIRTAAWWIRVLDGDGATLRETAGDGAASCPARWDGRTAAGAAVPDGIYAYRIDATDAWTNSGSKAGFVPGSTRPHPRRTLETTAPAEDSLTWFSPNGDGYRDIAGLIASTSESGSVLVHVRDEGGNNVVRYFSVPAGAVSVAVAWDGKGNDGRVVADGRYDVRSTPRDAAGNTGVGVTRSFGVAALLGFVATSKTLFYPHDSRQPRDGHPRVVHPDPVRRTSPGRSATRPARSSRRSPMARPWRPAPSVGRSTASVSTGRCCRPVATRRTSTRLTGRSRGARSSRSRCRRSASGRRPPRPPVGGPITVTAVSAETLSSTPRLYVTQPGKPLWSVAMTKLSGLTYRATVTMKTGGTGRHSVVQGRRLSRQRHARPALQRFRLSRCVNRERAGARPPSPQATGLLRTGLDRGLFGALLPGRCRAAYRQRSEPARGARARDPQPPARFLAPDRPSPRSVLRPSSWPRRQSPPLRRRPVRRPPRGRESLRAWSRPSTGSRHGRTRTTGSYSRRAHRVTVGFTPRSSDRWTVGGVAPQRLPAGRLDGKAMRAAGRCHRDPPPLPSHPQPLPLRLPSPPAEPPPAPPPDPSVDLSVDQPIVDPDVRRPGAAPASWSLARRKRARSRRRHGRPGRAAARGLRLPAVLGAAAPARRVHWDKLSTIAYFGVGADPRATS